MNEKTPLERIVFNIRVEERNDGYFRYVAENWKGETIFVNPFLYKKLTGGRFDGKAVYSMEEK